MSVFAVGDIHGYSSKLRGLLDQLVIRDDDTLVFLGDYVDRGPDSRGVVDILMGLQAKMPERCICLMGNHEDMMLDHWKQTHDYHRTEIDLSGIANYGTGSWLKIGGDKTLESYAGEIPEEHLLFLSTLPLTYETEDYIFVHAGLNSRGGTPRGQMLWGAQGFWSDVDPLSGRMIKGARRSFAKTVVVGHTHFDRPMVGADVIGIDTGCGHGGVLTAVQLPEVIFYSESDTGFAVNL